MSDLIDRQKAIRNICNEDCHQPTPCKWKCIAIEELEALPSAQPDRLTDDDFETIRIHLNSYKEKLCNQKRWKEAEEYQRIIDRFMAFASVQPRKGKWRYRNGKPATIGTSYSVICSECNLWSEYCTNFCPNCGADMRGDSDDNH